MLAPALVLSPYLVCSQTGLTSARPDFFHGLSRIYWSYWRYYDFLGVFNELTLLLLAAALGSASALHSPMRLALVPFGPSQCTA